MPYRYVVHGSVKCGSTSYLLRLLPMPYRYVVHGSVKWQIHGLTHVEDFTHLFMSHVLHGGQCVRVYT